MASLAETNPYLKDPVRRAQIIARSVYESSIFEGASPRALAKLKAIAYPQSKKQSKS